VTGENFYYEEGTNSIGGYFQETVDGAALRMTNQAKLELARGIEAIFHLHKFIPAQSDTGARVLPGFETLQAGPYTPSTLGITYKSTKNTNGGLVDPIGRLFSVSGTSASKCNTEKGTAPCVSSIQFSYGIDKAGNKIGNANVKDASPFNYAVPTGSRVHGVRALMDAKSILGIQFVHTQDTELAQEDGTSPEYGQQGFKANIDAEASPGYEITNIQYAKNPASTEGGLTAISFTYQFTG